MKVKSFYSIFGGKDTETFVSVDVGTSKIKAVVLDMSGEKPKLVSLGIAQTPASSIQNNAISNP